MRQKALLAGLRPAEKFLFTVVLLLILGLAFQFLGAFLGAWIYGYGITEILNLDSFNDPRYVAASKLIQILGTIGTFIIPAFLFSYLFAGDFFSYYHLRNRMDYLPLVLTVLIMISVIPLVNYLAELNMKVEFPIRGLDRVLQNLEHEAEEVMTAFMSTRSLWGLVVNLFMIGVLAAVGEELIFRGLLQRLLHEMIRNIHLAVIITAFLFAAFHFQFFSFLPRFLLGVIMGYLFFYGRSIWYPIVAHFVNNALGIVYYYFYARGSADDMLEEIGTSAMLPVSAIVSLVLVTFLFLWWYYFVSGMNLKQSAKHAGEPVDD